MQPSAMSSASATVMQGYSLPKSAYGSSLTPSFFSSSSPSVLPSSFSSSLLSSGSVKISPMPFIFSQSTFSRSHETVLKSITITKSIAANILLKFFINNLVCANFYNNIISYIFSIFKYRTTKGKKRTTPRRSVV